MARGWMLWCMVGMGLWAARAAAEDAVLNIYNWSDYIAPTTLAQFEQETGIKVRYDVFDTNELLEAKLLAGSSGYDLVVPSADFVNRQIQAGVFQPLDKTRLSRLANLDPEIMRVLSGYDPDNRHVLPWLWGTTGLGINRALVESRIGNVPLDTWQLLLNADHAKALADCGIALLDSPAEVVPSVLIALGLPSDSEDEAIVSQAFDALSKVRPHIRYFHSSQYVNDLANGELCLVLGYSGDILQARARAAEAGNGQTIDYRIPKEGALVWFDTLGIPSDAPHPENAHRFLDFILKPEVMAEVSNAVAYANANVAATPLVDAAVREDPGVYPDAETRQRLKPNVTHSARYDRWVNRAWTRFKTGQ